MTHKFTLHYDSKIGGDDFTLDYEDDNVTLHEVKLSAGWDYTEYAAEPYSWGGSRGMEREYEAMIYGAVIGDLYMKRAELIHMIGCDAVFAIESEAADLVADAEAHR